MTMVRIGVAHNIFELSCVHRREREEVKKKKTAPKKERAKKNWREME
ncbi:predicted protein [Sclerotinia sclerotiorum 1980 UF-70]|uniref:Uncharacterized protein n=1 Tax=Sclerotinia sclerotiorum (strain ATCC 18683 / 1980 / Ss-1) TaxID=665079 RepID=A7ENY3_SCLS1|nr:predicted protein [Sclerotinia sclerotiorum 1980 UF-70]EDO04549.1 predicted protein [Sclerotinia sclerotiorum 1980 UF-70]